MYPFQTRMACLKGHLTIFKRPLGIWIHEKKMSGQKTRDGILLLHDS